MSWWEDLLISAGVGTVLRFELEWFAKRNHNRRVEEKLDRIICLLEEVTSRELKG